ncbi:hypothetical protein BWD42_06045 [Sphingobacterium sp. CZ-UAM]|uniref:DNA topoisomerase IB n=1 Tax=Sphingobacterium sp. CZ-UAM TaxID=1933868 RepID=UPI00098679B3|nr:DNA topoisomerase IB [Sphingobacterium sp. CZ-UAM]OOG19484.1 hypothetical protein BWD42_06045 [Sphingobacterium sp. CZ-UAM]
MKTRDSKGYTRRKVRQTFRYFDYSGNEITDKKILERINLLAIPPNWKDVWISKNAKSDLQAYGFDQKARKQYIYHHKFVQQKQEEKFRNIRYMGQYLQELRKITSRQLKYQDWNMEKLCAIAFKIMDSTLVRIGNKRYTLENKSYGLSTLEKRHVKIIDNKITLTYKGKKGVFQKKSWKDKQQAKLLGELLQFKGKNVFQLDKTQCENTFCGRAFNSYLQQHCPGRISCKDIRVWGASREAFNLLSKIKQGDTLNTRKKQLNEVIKTVAKQLGNTKTVSQNYYIHPAIQITFLEGVFPFIKEKLTLSKLENRLFRFLLKSSKSLNAQT